MIVVYVLVAVLLAATTSIAILSPSFWAQKRAPNRSRAPNDLLPEKSKGSENTEGQQLPQSLPEHITAPFLGSAENNQIDRANWVRRATDYVFNDRHGAKYNVLTINDDLEYHLNVSQIVEEFYVKQKTPSGKVVPFRIVVFNVAELVNFGDGGYINWCFEGWFTRTGKGTVSFRVKENA